jgi:methionyl-tRNA synthetase
MTKPSFYTTTPIYYVNDVPHIGHAYTTVATDVISRYKRLCGFDVFFLTGTDEHGQKIEEAAMKKGITPIELADEVVERFSNLWKVLNISNNKFIRTTQEYHKKTVQKVFAKMQENGDIYLGEYEGWYCTPCETYWTETQVLDGNCCPSCGRKTSKLKEPSYFFKMSKYADKLRQHILDNPDFIQPVSKRNEILSFLNEGLKDLSVSRTTFKWGIPVPGDESHVIYVWIDALTNYISALGYESENEVDFKKYWPADFHIVGKDILRFHTVYWPTMLMSIGLPLPKSVFAHGWWTVEGQKMSKSLGNAINPYWLVEKFGVDAVRYFLLREVPFGLDGDFSFKALINRINSDLANDLGNLLNRTMGMAKKYFDGIIPEYSVSDESDEDLKKFMSDAIDEIDELMNKLAFNRALTKIWELVSKLNKYIDVNAPWSLAKDSSQTKRLESVLYMVLDGIRVLSLLIYPFMPDTAISIRKQLNSEQDLYKQDLNSIKTMGLLSSGVKLGDTVQLFPRIDEKEMLEKLKSENETKNEEDFIEYDTFMKSKLRVGKILEAEKIKKSKKLLKLIVDTGDRTRQIVSGIAQFYKPEDLIGKKVAVVVNLKPAKLMGNISEGMILSAESDGSLTLVEFPENVKVGSEIR